MTNEERFWKAEADAAELRLRMLREEFGLDPETAGPDALRGIPGKSGGGWAPPFKSEGRAVPEPIASVDGDCFVQKLHTLTEERDRLTAELETVKVERDRLRKLVDDIKRIPGLKTLNYYEVWFRLLDMLGSAGESP